MDGDDFENQCVSDVITDRSEIPSLRERFKSMARVARETGEDVTVEDLLAQSRRNDAAYVAPSDLEKANWGVEIYEQEGQPEIHPRGFHYQIIGKGYETRHGDEYVNSNSCWNELKMRSSGLAFRG